MQKSFDALVNVLDMEEEINRIECFDISHTAGEKPVASCIVFDPMGPLKSDYRRFNIKHDQPSDDYGALKEGLMRRYKRIKESDSRLPDLVLIERRKRAAEYLY